MAAAWHHLGADLERRVALLDRIPPGASVFGFARFADRRKVAWTRQMGLKYLHQYAVLRRHATVNDLFAYANQQPLRFRLPLMTVRPGRLDPPEVFDQWAQVFARYQYVFVTKLDEPYRRFLTARCRLVGRVADAALFAGCRARP